MDLPDDVLDTLFDAGADGLVFNAPLSAGRAVQMADSLSQRSVESVVDLGCGKGELARIVAEHVSGATVLGIDKDQRFIQAANDKAVARSLDGRMSFEIADAAEWSGSVDAAICVGASHAFGGTQEMLARLAVLVPEGTVLVGDSMWQSEPDAWCLETFGELPNGLDQIVELATAAGWTVDQAETSTLDEWDEFEQGWVNGVRSVGTTDANAFADMRAKEYLKYRGVLGFAWLFLTR